ncbi:O-antigen polysaccharide polymerase Wzy [Leptospira noguchii]|uniref:Putative membrane protein n=1 Tax=Leptospira noguchii serovar Panama str. CZ214 TaxID=1001595 RepID=T0GLX3_9LEPT|nr:O-antigen polysaccharide polymerase Wzy [Leptospira noguchii]EQA69887.1 putative membrane protein [Leptospira noguchii serovar Panama str. CZ214]
MIIEFVLFIILFLLLLIIKFNIKGSKLEIDHNFLIILGFIYYWYLPFIAYETNNLEQSLLANYDFVLKFYERVSYEAKVWYLITSVLLILSFLLGEIIFRKQSHKWNLLKKQYNFSKTPIQLFFYGLVLFGIISLKYMFPVLFRGYSAISEWPLQRGWFISVNVSLIVLFCIHASSRVDLYDISGKWKDRVRIFFNQYLIISILFGFLMYSTGNRGYLTLSVISIILILQKVLKGFRLIPILLIICILAVFNSAWGHIRAQNPVTFFKIIQSFFMEPGYVGMTLISHLIRNEFSFIEFPIPLLGNIIGIIPSIIFPEKFKYIQAITEMGKSISVFQGTTHNYVELMANFGLIGSMIFMFLLSLGLNFLKRNESLSGIYIAICSFLPFFFFRDLPNTLIKYIFEFTIILSILLYYSNFIIIRIKNKIFSRNDETD